jgi:hypothetical protein
MNSRKTVGAVAVLTALAAIGCGGLQVDPSKVVPAPEGAEEAFEIAANFYGLHARPTIVWYGGAALGCGDGTSYIDQTGTCVNGDQDGDLIILSDRGGMPLHRTALTHELGHLASDERGEGGDADHVGHFFRDPGEDLSMSFDRGNHHGLVGEANRLLESLGM